MSYPPAVIVAAAAAFTAVANLAYFKSQPAWRGSALILTGVLVAAASTADHAWWLAALGGLPLAWGLIILAALADSGEDG